MKTRNIEPQEWWNRLSLGERRLLCSVMRMLKGARCSQIKEVARAAAKWESGIGFFIKVRLMHDRSGRTIAHTGWLSVAKVRGIQERPNVPKPDCGSPAHISSPGGSN